MKTTILTISDTRTKETDLSGKDIRDILLSQGYTIADYQIIPDDKEKIKSQLCKYADQMKVDLILTSGGTGFSPRDVTPEATKEVIEKVACGIAEYMRMQGSTITKRAILSRATAGIRNQTLIINLPGSPKGARQSLESILSIIPHALDMIRGGKH